METDLKPWVDAPPLVSVVVPTFNRAHVIGESLDSILSQTYPNLEVIVVDDGSTDETAEVLEAYGDRITAVRQENRGHASARNTGLLKSTGEFVAWLDSDDLWEPDKTSLQVAFMVEHPDYVLVASDFSAFDDQGFFERSHLRSYYSAIDRTPGGLDGIFSERLELRDQALPFRRQEMPDTVTVYGGRIFEKLVWGNCLHPPTVMFRRDAAMAAGLLDSNFLQDADFEYFLRLSRLGRVAFIDHPLVKYRYSEDQMSSDKHLARIALSRLRVFEMLRAKEPALVEAHRSTFRRRVGSCHLSAAHALAEERRGAAVAHWLKSLAWGHVAGDTLRTLVKLFLPQWALAAYRRRRHRG